MGIIDTIIYYVKRAFRRKAEEKVEEAVEDAVDKAVDKATDKALKESGVTVSNSTTEVEEKSLNEEAKEENASGNVTININVSGNAAPAAQAYATSLAQANEVLSYLILDKNNNVIGVKDDAPEYIKNAYANGEFNE